MRELLGVIARKDEKLGDVLLWQLLHWVVPVGMCGGDAKPGAVVLL